MEQKCIPFTGKVRENLEPQLLNVQEKTMTIMIKMLLRLRDELPPEHWIHKEIEPLLTDKRDA